MNYRDSSEVLELSCGSFCLSVLHHSRFPPVWSTVLLVTVHIKVSLDINFAIFITAFSISFKHTTCFIDANSFFSFLFRYTQVKYLQLQHPPDNLLG